MNDKNLIQKCQQGDKQAFNELITKYYPYVQKFLIKLTTNEELAMDLVQDTFLKMIKNIDKYDINKETTFSTYLIQISKNTYLDYLRKNKRLTYEENIEQIVDTNFMEEKITNEEELNMVLKELENLPFEQAQAIKMKYLEEYSLKDIAKKMGTESKTIKSRIYERKRKNKKEITKWRCFIWIKI